VKRTPLVRKTPMRSQSQLKRSKKKPGVTADVAQAVKRRSGGICERCRVAPGTELHHRVCRSRGGPHDEFNLVDLCYDCHHVHAHGMLEHPWYVRGRFIRGEYRGKDESYQEHYAPAA
jgi:5-methylcytosine-specific restriction endonuclease McrA